MLDVFLVVSWSYVYYCMYKLYKLITGLLVVTEKKSFLDRFLDGKITIEMSKVHFPPRCLLIICLQHEELCKLV